MCEDSDKDAAVDVYDEDEDIVAEETGDDDADHEHNDDNDASGHRHDACNGPGAHCGDGRRNSMAFNFKVLRKKTSARHPPEMPPVFFVAPH